jgi:hypothetical protein
MSSVGLEGMAGMVSGCVLVMKDTRTGLVWMRVLPVLGDRGLLCAARKKRRSAMTASEIRT